MNTRQRKALALLAASAGVIVTAGCSSSSNRGSPPGGLLTLPTASVATESTTAPDPVVSFPNPVPFLVKAGAKPDNGAVNGQVSIDEAYKYADGTFPSGQTITVYAYKTKVAQQADLAMYAEKGAQDGQAIIYSTTGPLFTVSVNTPSGQAFSPTPDVIALKVGGTIQSY